MAGLDKNYGDMVLENIKNRGERNLWMWSWPYRMTRVLLGEEVAQKTCNEFQDDLKVFQDFVAWPGKNKELDRMEKRSVFQLTCNKQYQEALQDTGGRCTPSLVELARSRVSGLGATQLIEDMNGLQKSTSQQKACIPQPLLWELCCKVIL